VRLGAPGKKRVPQEKLNKMLVDCFQQIAPTLPRRDDVGRVSAPGERRGVLVVLPEERVQRRPDCLDRGEEPVLQHASGDLGEDAFDGVRP